MLRDAEGAQTVDRVEIPQVTPNGHDLSEQLAAEIFPRLERPSRELGPLVRDRRLPSNPTEVVAVWTATSGSGLEDLVTRWTAQLPSPLAWLTSPSPDYAAQLRLRGMPLCTRPLWCAFHEHRVAVIHLVEALEILDLCSLLASLPDPTRRPRMVAVGPGVRPLAGVLPHFVDLALDVDDETEALKRIAEAARGDGDPLKHIRDWAGSAGVLVHEGSPDPTTWPTWPTPPKREDLRPVAYQDRLLGPEDLSCARVEISSLGEGGRRAEVWLLSASAARREELGIAWNSACDAQLAEAIADPWTPLRLHLAVGLPGDGGLDLRALEGLLGDLRRTVGEERRLEIQLHPYSEFDLDPDSGCPDPTDLAAWSSSCEAMAQTSRVRVAPPRELLPLLHQVLGRDPEAAAELLRRVFAHGAFRSHSRLATDANLWEKSMQEAKLEPPDSRRWPESEEAASREPGHGCTIPARVRASQEPATAAKLSPRWRRWQALVPRRFDVRVIYRTRGLMKFLSQGELGATIARLCRSGDLPLATTGRVQPKLRMSFGPWLAPGIEGVREYLDLSFRRKVAEDDLLARLSDGLPQGLEILAAMAIPAGQPQLALSRVALAEYEVSLEPEGRTDPDATRQLPSQLSLRVEALREKLATADGTSIDDLHHQLRDVRLSTEGDAAARLAFTLDLLDPGPKRKPHDFLGLLLGDLVEDVRTLPIRRTGLFVRDESRPTPHWRDPAEILERTRWKIREAEKTCA